MSFLARNIFNGLTIPMTRAFSTSKYIAAARVQHPAPDFKGKAVVNGEFKDIQLSDFRGKYLVLFFYPLDLYEFILLLL